MRVCWRIRVRHIPAMAACVGLTAPLLFVLLLFTSTQGSLAQSRPQSPKSGPTSISVGPNVQVSKANADREHAEVFVAADPVDPKHLLGCSMVMPSGPIQFQVFHTIAYASFDGGNSWQPTLEETNRGEWGNGDPWCAFGSDGTAYFTSLTSEIRLTSGKTLVRRSRDGGRTWEAPVSLPIVDRDTITADRTGGKHAGHLYINGTPFILGAEEGQAHIGRGLRLGFQLMTSSDNGATFRPSVLRAAFEEDIHWVNGNGVVLSDGTFGAIYYASEHLEKESELLSKRPNGSINFLSSSDGGESLSQTMLVSVTRGGEGIPVLGVDETTGPFRDRLYAAWHDYADDRSQIMLSYSSDKGKTWSKPTIVNDDGSRAAPGVGPDDFQPAVAVNNKGMVGISWYDRRDNPDNLGYYLRFAASRDGGETFGPSVRVSDLPSTYGDGKDHLIPRIGGGGNDIAVSSGPVFDATVAYDIFPGDYAGLAAGTDGTFHPFWVDNRTRVRQVWTAQVKVQGDASQNGSAELAELQDVTGKVALEFCNPVYDFAKKTVTLDAYLKNKSQVMIKVPIKARVLSMHSQIGLPTLMNADNDISGPGGVFDFSSVVEGTVLKPDERTRAKRLEVRLSDVQWPSGTRAPSALTSFLQMNVKVLAKFDSANSP